MFIENDSNVSANLATYTHSNNRGTKGLESQIKPSDNPVTISDDTRIAIEKVGDTTASISRGRSVEHDSHFCIKLLIIRLL